MMYLIDNRHHIVLLKAIIIPRELYFDGIGKNKNENFIIKGILFLCHIYILCLFIEII